MKYREAYPYNQNGVWGKAPASYKGRVGGHSDEKTRAFPNLKLEELISLGSGICSIFWDCSNIVYLLDGFDEIGTQSWSSDPRRMQYIRRISVCALKDLLQKVQGGVLITGREYYFNSDKVQFTRDYTG